ncbi:MAG: aldehyde dehydrogenase family protein [Deltaproteobacteria bacterium]|nr:aldehyde dehydrogenase family protein [Deltaproteobacteria bacterium]
MDFARGNYIDNQWIKPATGTMIRSINPARLDEIVLEAPTSTAHASEAVAAAARAWPAWAGLSVDDRIAALRRFARELTSRTEALARAITQEMGKTIREARQEATGLIARVDMVIDQQLPQVKTWSPPNIAGECRYHPLGVIGVLGPFNFPLHLCHAHIIPALATGNTVVVKPSERTPLAFQRYMEAWDAANMPPILHMVQGGADVGKAILQARELRGIAFTGSWRVGHQITKSLVDRPEVLAALEMGGQNMCIVLEDADLDQALEGVLLGGYLTTGQRCTCTARVLVQRSIAPAFIDRLVKAARNLTFGDPMSDVFMGPMASVGDRDRVEALCRAGREAGADALLPAELRDGGAWRGPSLHLIAPDHDSDYTREEVFGPDLAVTIVDDLDHALSVVRTSPYGLSVGLFSARRQAFEQVYLQTSVGCVSWNRSTNRTLGALPFGGVGKSGNYRPAGSDAVRYTTYPVQVLWNDPGVLENDPYVRQATSAADPLMALEAMHRIEEALEPYGVHPEIDPSGRSGVVKLPLSQLDLGGVVLSRPLVEHLRQRRITAEIAEQAVRIPLPFGNEAPRILARALADALHALRSLHLARFLGRRPAGAHVPPGVDGKPSLPRSAALMKRLVGGDFVPDDKLPPVIDLYRSSGPYLASVDDDPIVFMDAASQLATHAAGLNPPAVLEALVDGRFGALPLDAGNAEAHPSVAAFAARLRSAIGDTHPFVRFSGSGAEANEVALAVCAARRPGKKAVVAFRGASHGRTMLALHATWKPEKRLRFELAGHEARWLDLPVWNDVGVDATGALPVGPPEPAGWLDRWRTTPAARPPSGTTGDALLDDEIRALEALEATLADDQVAAVMIEPMQAEGGERHATPRFFRALRVVTERAGVPLVMDEVQCGFHLGGPFFWHETFALPSPPDVVTSARKAQVGVTLSRWPIPVRAEVAGASALRGAIYAELLDAAERDGRRAAVMSDAAVRLAALAKEHPALVLNPRLMGWSFGFDLPTAPDLDHLVEQRLWRGYMIHGAGDRALGFRLHPEVTPAQIAGLFERLDGALSDRESGAAASWRDGATESLSDVAPAWPPQPPKLPTGTAGSYKLVRVGPAEWPSVRGPYEALQKQTYAARADDFDAFTALVPDPDTIVFAIYWTGPQKPSPSSAPQSGAAIVKQGTLVAACIGFALEHVAHLDGPRQDPSLGRGETLYSADLTVHADHRGQGLGRALEEAQIAAAIAQRRPDGGARYVFMTGRNRVGAAEPMAALSAPYGGWIVARHAGQRGAPEAATDYYRIPLTFPRLPPAAQVQPWPGGHGPAVLDLETGLERRLGPPQGLRPGNEELREHLAEGRLNGAIVNKLSLCSFVTPALVRAHEWLRLQAPKRMRHLVLASGRCEALDKTLRSIKHHRGKARTAIALGPVRAGQATAAARGVTLPAGDDMNWLGWPTLADPTRDPERALLELKKVVADRGADDILAIVVEPVYLATGRVVPEGFWGQLRQAADEHGLPIVLVENTTAGHRNGKGFWRADTLPVPVDAVIWYPGGQLGLGFVADRYYVPDKLTLDSTWDGDELSLTRLMWELRIARTLPVAQRASELRKALAPLGEVQGEGLFLTIETSNAELVCRRLAERGVRVGLEERLLRVAPPLNLTSDDVARIAAVVRELAS